TSMYLFANLGLLAAIFARPSTSTGQVMLNALPEFLRRRLWKFGPDRAGALVLALGLIPMAIDGFTQLSGRYESTPIARVLTGGLAGFVGGLLVGAMLVTIRQFSLEMRRMYAHMQADTASLRGAKVFQEPPVSDARMARRKRKDDVPDWTSPEVDEVGYMGTGVGAVPAG